MRLLDTRLAVPAPSRRLVHTWFGLLALSQLADLVTTWWSLGAGLREDNPVVAATLGAGHFGLYALVKVVLVAAFGVALLGGRPAALHGARLLVLVFSLVALANLLSPALG